MIAEPKSETNWYRAPVTMYTDHGGTFYKSCRPGYVPARSTIQRPSRLDTKIQRLYSLSDQEVLRDWKSFAPASQTYIEHYFPSLYKKCLEAIERYAAKEQE